ncbi:MAG TPA: fluoride efflux transporter CrcB [Gammaproteobacteria bacterium]
MNLIQVIVIATGGAIGALLRYWMSIWVYSFAGQDFPYGTLAVNVSGSLLIGFLYILIERMGLGIEWRAALLIGLIGAFTTFSSFSLETLNLFEQGEQLKAAMNIVLSVVLCLFATWLGMLAARQL